MLVIRTEFGRPGSDTSIAGQDHVAARADEGKPLQIVGASRYLGELFMAWIEDVLTTEPPQQLA